jgi:spoIIIJ-associated protein
MARELVRDGVLDRKAAAAALHEFLETLVRAGRFDLQVRVRATLPGSDHEDPDAEVLADLDGPDKAVLLERGGEVLQSIEHLALRALRLEPEWREKIHIDCGGYRALRLEELRMMARVAAERVRATHQPFRLNPMSSRERRIVHLALKNAPGIRTESIGTGENRRVVIHPEPGTGT